MKQRGFTLIEIVLVITLTSIIIFMIFSSLRSIRLNELKIENLRMNEKNIYFFFNSMTKLFKNASSVTIFNNRNRSNYFLGEKHKVVFLSKNPLISPFHSLFFIDVKFDKNKIYYKEQKFNGEPKVNSFDVLEDENPYILFDDVDNLEFKYFSRDYVEKRNIWKDNINSFEKDSLPLRVKMSLKYKKKEYEFIFNIIIKDQYEEIPKQLIK